jgi:hypothetical protein
MEIEYNYDSKAIWTVSIKYLLAKRYYMILLLLNLLVYGMIHILKGEFDSAIIFITLVPVLLLFGLFNSIRRISKRNKELPDDIVKLVFDDKGVTSISAGITTVRS